jgi:hypothetical protein
MYLRTNQQARERRYQRLGQGLAAAPGPVKDLICSDSDLRKLNRLLNRTPPLTKDSLRQRVEDEARDAVAWIQTAAKALVSTKRTLATNQFFKEAFGTTPDAVPSPSWLPSGKSWGEIVSKRLQRAGEILAGGNIEYRCGSPQTCPLCKRALGAPYYGCSEHGQYYICLGLDFWKAWDSEPETQISTLIHEALHIYFDIVEHGVDRLNNANCYVRFVRRCNGAVISKRLDKECSPAPP